jgi:hypothetical protein
LRGHPAAAGIDAVLRHIERAENHLIKGRESGDDEAFNDVVYRANQAFEGPLKEAFLVLTDEREEGLSAHQIEQRLLHKRVLVPRVADLLTNYRRQWRNPSTHDHRLVFRDQEAFLAIISVSAFVSVLVDQMVEELNRQREHAEAERRQQQIRLALGDYEQLPFDEQVVKLLDAFGLTSLPESWSELPDEFEILGRLSGFVTSADPAVQIVRDPGAVMKPHHSPQPDLVLEKNGSTVVLDLRRVLPSRYNMTCMRQQVASYLLQTGWAAGVVYVPPLRGQETRSDIVEWSIGGRLLRIHAVYAVDSQPTPLESILGK